MSGHAQVHMVGAIVALVFLPLGILYALRGAGAFTRRLGSALVVVAALVGTLVVLSAAGVDTAGLGAPRSWALWQGALVIVEMLLVSVHAVESGRARIPAVGAER